MDVVRNELPSGKNTMLVKFPFTGCDCLPVVTSHVLKLSLPSNTANVFSVWGKREFWNEPTPCDGTLKLAVCDTYQFDAVLITSDHEIPIRMYIERGHLAGEAINLPMYATNRRLEKRVVRAVYADNAFSIARGGDSLPI